jgi:hypothetical protein
MRLVSLTVLWVALCASVLAADTPQGIQQQMIDADRGVWQAIAGPRPRIAQVRDALAPEYIDMELGICHSRDDVLKDLEAVTSFSFQYNNPRAFVLSPTSGYVIAELTYSSVSNGASASGRVLTTTVFSKDHGRWIAHLHTEMDLKPDAGAPGPPASPGEK